MSVTIDRTVDNQDGTVTVYAATPGRNYCHVVVGRDKVADGTVYLLLDLAAAKADSKARALATQRMHDDGSGNVDSKGM